MLSRLDKRNVILDHRSIRARSADASTKRRAAARSSIDRRTAGRAGRFAVAGFVSGLLGIGGGILQVPALNAWCGVPLRAAAATSAVMIGVTAVGVGAALLCPRRRHRAAGGRRGARRARRIARRILVRRAGARQVAEAADGGGAGVRVDHVSDEGTVNNDLARISTLESILARLMLAGVTLSAISLAAGLALCAGWTSHHAAARRRVDRTARHADAASGGVVPRGDADA